MVPTEMPYGIYYLCRRINKSARIVMGKNKLKIGEFSRLGCECPEPGYCYTIEHGGYKPQDIDIEYCEKVTKKGTDSALIKFKDIPVVPLAACLKVFGPYDKLYDNHVELFAYLEKEGYKIVAAPRAVYIDGIWNQEDADKWLTIIQAPVEKA